MSSYYANTNEQADGYHEVHKTGCSHFPDYSNCKYLGDFTNCKDAVIEARKYYVKVDGCYYCCLPCHTR